MLKLSKITLPRTSIRLNVMVVCEIVLLLFLSLTVLLYFSRQGLKEEAFQDAEETLEGTVQHIDNILMSVEQTAYNVYQELQGHLDNPDRMPVYCREIIENNPYVTGCAIAFKPYYYKDQELFMSYVHQKVTEDGVSTLVTSNTFGKRPYSQQEWYTAPLNTGHACWTDPMAEEEDEGVTLSLCLPIYAKHAKAEERSKEDILGVMAVDVPVSLLSQIILAMKPLPHSYSVLLGHSGSYIVHPDTKKLMRQETIFDLEANGADISVREAAEAMLAGKTGYKSFRKDGEDWYVFYKPFQRSWSTKAAELGAREFGIPMEKLGWSAGLVYLEDDIVGEYNFLVYLVLAITFAGVLLFFILCRMVVNQQMRPLRMLNKSAQRIIEGHYHEEIPYTPREDEIGQLQNRFRKMQQSLAGKSDELEQLTATLTKRSKELKKAYGQAKGSDRMKTTFLHYMTNQMTVPSDLIERSVTKLSNNFEHITPAEAEYEVSVIKKQSEVILDVLDHMVEALEIEKEEDRKEVAHE
jgi:methyl-accepting chemotaxis protein/sigma-B regulation protein RsbU (phosphoserine phosphatase)